MLASYKSRFDVDFVSIRMSHTIGPNISLTDGRTAEFIRNVVEGEDIILHIQMEAQLELILTFLMQLERLFHELPGVMKSFIILQILIIKLVLETSLT